MSHQQDSLDAIEALLAQLVAELQNINEHLLAIRQHGVKT